MKTLATILFTLFVVFVVAQVTRAISQVMAQTTKSTKTEATQVQIVPQVQTPEEEAAERQLTIEDQVFNGKRGTPVLTNKPLGRYIGAYKLYRFDSSNAPTNTDRICQQLACAGDGEAYTALMCGSLDPQAKYCGGDAEFYCPLSDGSLKTIHVCHRM